ncbi:ribonuclease toxin immunity protein CdiI [Herbaspirillum sp. WGmk3]|uniref:ribonuclease toxin immunity protein CdiI n=1 Tax=Herbaspirillum sp. WGmk3 TaxID=2919925 RepID=UPI0020905DA4|nr:ribonuclease toxin immunity protein CdiI [Herbaspirillum sp. WGmk3]MCO4859205.1 ribonuclease toxin immunity protein CdiI [Herbaspirillum sp. WGmk3]
MKIFENINYKIDPDWIVKVFFNSLESQNRFLWALRLMVDRRGCAVNYDYCFFSDLSDPDPEYHFLGVKIGFGDNEIQLTDEEFAEFLGRACERYMQLHPEEKDEVTSILQG